MRDLTISVRCAVIAVMAFVCVLGSAKLATAQQEKILYNFDGAHGRVPSSGLVSDPAGNLYGTTAWGGSQDYGTVYELSPMAGGKWKETVLHNFLVNGIDGAIPEGGLIFDSAGNLYGTTSQGGTYGAGTVFELSPTAKGLWTETIFHNFNDKGTDGAYPLGGVVFDAAGNLYGTTSEGGIRSGGQGWGTVFKLTRNARGQWTEKILYNFSNTGSGGYYPRGEVVIDGAGNLYGTTTDYFGTVFELSPAASSWTYSVIHAFPGFPYDGSVPFAGLIIDPSGNLYGTTSNGGGFSDRGTVFEVSTGTEGSRTERVVYDFGPDRSGVDGQAPEAGLFLDAAGNLYGTTYQGGATFWGTVFKLTPTASGQWSEQIMHGFSKDGIDGYEPTAPVIVDSFGNIFGTTTSGGANGYGVVFEIRP